MTVAFTGDGSRDPMLCLHRMVGADSRSCPCSIECDCKKAQCKPRTRKTNRERITGSSASIQTVGTPEWLVKSIELTWSAPILLDAAADAENHVCECYVTKETDALSLPYWASSGLIFFNPPFKKIGKFCEKAVESAENGQRVIGLVLASVGSKWWRDFVNDQADAFFINRIHFKGHSQVFMKDLAVLHYSPSTLKIGGSYQCCRLEEGKVQDLIEASGGS